jgi:Selenoprotein, putative
MTLVMNLFKAFWDYLREVSGENDYPRYRKRMSAEGRKALCEREFYDQRQKEKYSRQNRCC